MSPRTDPTTVPLRKVGYFRVDTAIQHYLTPLLLTRWPRLRTEVHDQAEVLERLVVDVWLCGEPPPRPPRSPSLILGPLSPADTQALDVVAAHVWQLSTPVTGRRLLANLQALARQRQPPR